MISERKESKLIAKGITNSTRNAILQTFYLDSCIGGVEMIALVAHRNCWGNWERRCELANWRIGGWHFSARSAAILALSTPYGGYPTLGPHVTTGSDNRDSFLANRDNGICRCFFPSRSAVLNTIVLAVEFDEAPSSPSQMFRFAGRECTARQALIVYSRWLPETTCV